MCGSSSWTSPRKDRGEATPTCQCSRPLGLPPGHPPVHPVPLAEAAKASGDRPTTVDLVLALAVERLMQTRLGKKSGLNFIYFCDGFVFESRQKRKVLCRTTSILTTKRYLETRTYFVQRLEALIKSLMSLRENLLIF